MDTPAPNVLGWVRGQTPAQPYQPGEIFLQRSAKEFSQIVSTSSVFRAWMSVALINHSLAFFIRLGWRIWQVC